MIRTPNKSQQEAIESTDGPLLSIAGPGSRKTYTLVERMVLLTRTKSAAPCLSGKLCENGGMHQFCYPRNWKFRNA